MDTEWSWESGSGATWSLSCQDASQGLSGLLLKSGITITGLSASGIVIRFQRELDLKAHLKHYVLLRVFSSFFFPLR